MAVVCPNLTLTVTVTVTIHMNTTIALALRRPRLAALLSPPSPRPPHAHSGMAATCYSSCRLRSIASAPSPSQAHARSAVPAVPARRLQLARRRGRAQRTSNSRRAPRLGQRLRATSTRDAAIGGAAPKLAGANNSRLGADRARASSAVQSSARALQRKCPCAYQLPVNCCILYFSISFECKFFQWHLHYIPHGFFK